jgi:hypothetical protein
MHHDVSPHHPSASQAAEEKGQSHRLAACWDAGLLPEEAKSPVLDRQDCEGHNWGFSAIEMTT